MARYVLPNDVHSPKRFWSLLSVLRDDGEGGSALALGRWAFKPVLAIRWNGVKDNPLGNPQSRGLPTWFIVPEPYADAILSTLDAARLKLAQNFLK